MMQNKYLLMGIWMILGLNVSYAQKALSSEPTPAINYHAVKQMCEHHYNSQEIRFLKQAAKQGNTHAQLQLSIWYEQQALRGYQQIIDGSRQSEEKRTANHSALPSTEIEDVAIARRLSNHRLSLCDAIQD